MRFQLSLCFVLTVVLATSGAAAPQGKGRAGGSKSSPRSAGGHSGSNKTGAMTSGKKSGLNSASMGMTSTGSSGVPNPYAGKNPYQSQGTGQANRTSGSAQRASGRPSKSGGTRKEESSGSRDLSNASPEVQKLASDLQGLKSESQVTQAQKDDVKNSLMAMADGATKPDPTLVADLSSDLSVAMADGELSTREMAQLSNDLEKVMNSANIPMAEVQAAISSIQTVLTASGVDKADVQMIVTDLQAIAKNAQTKATGAKSSASSKSRPRLGGRRGG